MNTWVVIWLCNDDNDPMAVKANSAKAAAKMVVNSGPYNWTEPPTDWENAPHVTLEVDDEDGAMFGCKVYGPL